MDQPAILTLLQYAQTDNVATLIDQAQLDKIGRKVCEGYEEDKASRKEWWDKSKRAMDMALQVTEEKSFPWQNASNVKYPLLTTAALQFHARAYPAVVQGNNVVKGQVVGRDETGQKSQSAERIAAHMNYQILEEMPEWEQQMDTLLLALPIEGCEFKKSYFDPAKGRNCSEWVRPQHLVVNYKTKTLKDCPRVTHEIDLYPHEIYERQRLGIYVDADLNISSDDDEDEKPQRILEQHCLWDLDGDGVKEPWVVTVHDDSQTVLRIRSRFEPEKVLLKIEGRIMSAEQAAQIDPTILQYTEIAKIEAENYFTKYSFIPSPDGGFYDLGFGQLLDGLTDVINTNINQLVDAGTLQNLPGGYRDKRVKMVAGDNAFRPGELKPVENASAMPISQAIHVLQWPGPSPVLFNLLGLLIEAAKDITSVKDILTGESPANETATTALARIEQGLSVFSAIYKRIYRALKEEFKLIKRLNALYLPPESYFRVLDTGEPAMIWQQDYMGDEADVIPVADPSVSTSMQRMAKAQFLMNFLNDPQFNPTEIKRRVLEAAQIEGIDQILIPHDQLPQPGPTPDMIEAEAEAAKTYAEAQKTMAEIQKVYADAIKSIAEAESKEAGTQLAQYKAQLETIRMELEARNAQQGRTGPMEGAPGNAAGAGPTEAIPPELAGLLGGGAEPGPGQF